jgi:hypothetical protein
MLNQHFYWNKARMNCFGGILVALFKLKNMNLTDSAGVFFPGRVQTSDLQRTFQLVNANKFAVKYQRGYHLNAENILLYSDFSAELLSWYVKYAL